MEYILNKNLVYNQPENAFRGGLDAVLLAMSTPIVDSGHVLDVGAGAGAVGLIYAHCTPDSIYVDSIEKSETFVKFAKDNIQQNGFNHRMQAICADIATFKPIEKYAVVMTNPPYKVDTSTPPKNPLKYIAHVETTVCLTHWIQFCLKSVIQRGVITMIHKTDRLPHIIQALGDTVVGLKVLPIITKAGIPPSRVIVHIKKGSKSPFVMYPPLTIYKNGVLTKTATKILNGQQNIILS